MAEGTDIGALGADAADQVIRFIHLLQRLQLVDGDRAGLTLHGLSLAGQVVELLTVDFNGGVHGRDLLDIPQESRHGLLHIGGGNRYRVGLQGLAAGILGVGDKA